MITGTKFVIDAIAGARDVASLMDRYLGGNGEIDETLVTRMRETVIGKSEQFSALKRQELTTRQAAKRINDFCPVTDGFNFEQATAEARRCLQCDLRTDIKHIRPG